MTFAFRSPAARLFCPGLETKEVPPARIFSRMFTSILGVGLRSLLQNDLNLRALTRHGAQDELTTDLVNSFLHSHQSEAFMFRMQFKSNTVVHKTELDFIRGNGQSGSERL